ncbi:MAG: hypothetical protein DRP74_08915, partial [Candidatus Omnitrophota bacterium]
YTFIPSGHYLRVIFSKNLTSDRDITIYAKSNTTATIEVYEKDGNEIIATFENVSEEGWYKVYLTNLIGEEDEFDLRVLSEVENGGGVEVDYVVDPAVISTSTTTNALWTTKTHSIHYANGYYWAVFHNGSNVVIYSSSDGTNWTSQGVVSSTIDTEQGWAVTFDNTDIIVAIGDNSANLIYYRHGTLNNDGTVSWGSEQQVDCDGSADQYNFVEISGSKPLIGGLHGYNNVAPRVYVGSSITDSPSFSEETPSAPSSAPPYTSSSARSPTIIKSGDSDGDFSVFAGFVHTGRSDSKDIQINTYDASTDSWEGWETIVDDDLKNIHPPYKTYDVARDSSGNLHLLYIDLSGNINHKKGTAATPPVWSTISSDVTGLTSHTMLSVASDGSGNIYLFYDKGDNGIYYRIYDGNNWGNENVLKGADSNTLQSITTSRTVDSNGEVLVAWVEGSSSPYNIRFGKAHHFSLEPVVRVSPAGTSVVEVARNSKGHIVVVYVEPDSTFWAAYYNGTDLPSSYDDWTRVMLIGNTTDGGGVIANTGRFSAHFEVFIRNDIMHVVWVGGDRDPYYSKCNVSDDISAIATTSNWKKADGTQGYDHVSTQTGDHPSLIVSSDNRPMFAYGYNRFAWWSGSSWTDYSAFYSEGDVVSLGIDENDMVWGVFVNNTETDDVMVRNVSFDNAGSASGWSNPTVICSNSTYNFDLYDYQWVITDKNNYVYVLCTAPNLYKEAINWWNGSEWQEGTGEESGVQLITDFIRSGGGGLGTTPDGYTIALGSQHTGLARQYNNRETPPFRTLNYYYGDPEDGFDSWHAIEKYQPCNSDELLWTASNDSGIYLFKFDTATGDAWWCPEEEEDTTPPYFVDIYNVTKQEGQEVNEDFNASDNVAVDCWQVNDTTHFAIDCTGQLTNATNLAIGLYWINLTINDTSNNINSTVIWVNITPADTTPPTITLISPANDTGDNDGNVTFMYNVTDASNIASCSLIINGQVNKTETSITKDTTQNITTYLPNGNYNWSINCTDSSGNEGASEIRKLAIIKITKYNSPDISSLNVSNITNFYLEKPNTAKINFTD